MDVEGEYSRPGRQTMRRGNWRFAVVLLIGVSAWAHGADKKRLVKVRDLVKSIPKPH